MSLSTVAGSAERIIQGDLRALARAATAVENRSAGAIALLQELFPRTGRALIVGVTGSPGAGKSTFCAALTGALRRQGKSVGIIAVDPTSPYTGGAILGDRIRMQQHHQDPGVFIRSMATRGWMGGLAHATTDMALLLDAAGRDIILVETVGVGQDEVDIARLADVTLVVLVPGMGDDVQAIKAGIMEIADVFVINKADQPGAEKVERELKTYQTLSHRPDGWQPPIVKTISTESPDKSGMDDVLAAIESYRSSGIGNKRAPEIWRLRLREMIRERLLERLSLEDLNAASVEVAERRRDPYSIVEEWLAKL
jgi:LAO/AO transport system kinase